MGIAQVLIVDEMASLAIPTLHQLLAAPVPLVLLLGTLSGAEGTGEKRAKNLDGKSDMVCRKMDHRTRSFPSKTLHSIGDFPLPCLITRR